MPVLPSRYPGPPAYQLGGHLQTILPNLARAVPAVAFRRERLELPDGDFLDLDHSYPAGTRGTVVVGHGLEGSADRPYVRGTAHYFGRRGWRVCAINFRSCSGELNRLRRMYHHGDYPDLAAVLAHLQTSRPDPLAYVGFSMGGNIGLNLVGRRPAFAAQHLAAVVAFSSPLYLGDSIAALDRPLGRLYSRRFWDALAAKLEAKAAVHDIPHLDTLRRTRDWDAFDRAFSLPLHGYPAGAVPTDFYDDVSPVDHLDAARVPTLIVQALNDPMLAGRCYETAFAKTNDAVVVEHPREGGHVGFALPRVDYTYAEARAYAFVEEAMRDRPVLRPLGRASDAVA